MNSFKKLMNFMTGNKLLYIFAIIAVGIATVFSTIIPLLIKFTLDSILNSNPIDNSILAYLTNLIGGTDYIFKNIWLIGLSIIVLTIFRGYFMYLKGKLAAQASENTAKNMRNVLYNHLQRLPYDYHVKSETGDLIQRCTSDIETIRRFLATQFVTLGQAIFMLFITLAVMLSLNTKLTLVAMIIVPFIFAFSLIFFQKVKTAFTNSDEAEGRMSTSLQENLTGMRVVRAFARESYEIDKFDKKNKEFTDLNYKLVRLFAFYWSFSDLLCLSQAAIVLIYGSWLTHTGVISLGTLTVFITYESMLLWPVRQMGRILADMGKATVSLKRIQHILDEPLEDLASGDSDHKILGSIEFKNVSFSYDDKVSVLNNISFNVKSGQTLAILGPTGSGKSSLVHLLTRLYDYSDGSILIDGINIRDINKSYLRKNIGLILQEPFLYAKTIGENIKIAKRNASHTELISSAQIACVHDVIEEFDKGYDTLVGEKGVSLSGGQKQRIAIARTLINDCPVIIFDDSLSAVDTETDINIRTALKSVNKSASKIIISHRVSSLSEADLILVLDKGEIIESGTHDSLINNKGLYHRVWNLQNNFDENLKTSV